MFLGSSLQTPREQWQAHQRSPNIWPSRMNIPSIAGPSVPVPAIRNIDSDVRHASSQKDDRMVFRVGADYGATFTSVGFVKHSVNDSDPVTLPWNITKIKGWSQDGREATCEQLPTEIWYSKIPMRRDLSEQPCENLYDAEEDDETAAGDGNGPALRRAIDALEEDEDIDGDNDESPDLLWGYGVPYHLNVLNTSRNPNRLIALPKLLLVDTPYTKQTRSDLRPLLKQLKRKQIITSDQDVITDFLVPVFRHTKKQLVKFHSFQENSLVEFAVTVPAIWSQKSSRILQAAVESAIRLSNFGSLEHGNVINLIIISEPEAAATALAASSRHIIAGDTFTIMDCGGVTVDGATYTVDMKSLAPLQLEGEVVPPGGDNCGASYLNLNFRNLMLERLKDETYLEYDGVTIDSIVRSMIPDFENYSKRNVDVTKPIATHYIQVPGLRADPTKRFLTGKVTMIKKDYLIIFKPLLLRVERVLRTQLALAKAEGQMRREKPARQGQQATAQGMAMIEELAVRKVFLVGGFGNAPSLKSHLRNVLAEISRDQTYNTSLITADDDDSHDFSTVVVCGAVLRLLDIRSVNRPDGPDRIAQSSFGFLRREVYNSELQAHQRHRPEFDKIDGLSYLHTVLYFLIKNEPVPFRKEYGPFPSIHTFRLAEPELKCEEVLYVSDTATEPHYNVRNQKNKIVFRNAHELGRIVVDMTFLRTKRLIEAVMRQPEERREDRYWKIELELMAVVEGRTMSYYARYPAGGTVMGTAQISITAAFLPGKA